MKIAVGLIPDYKPPPFTVSGADCINVKVKVGCVLSLYMCSVHCFVREDSGELMKGKVYVVTQPQWAHHCPLLGYDITTIQCRMC